jgi:competence protein ComEC
LEALAAWRQDIRDRLWLRAGTLAQPGVLAALTVGDQSAIDTPGWDRFRATGVAHLMSISGLHITLFAWLAAAVVTALWRRWPAGMARWPAPVAGLWGGLLLATAYAGLAGWGVPAQRTVWMLALAIGLKTCGLRWPAPLLCLVAGVGVSCADPWALLQAGFWLSFVAVGLLLLSGPPPLPTPAAPPESAAGPAATVRLRAWVRRCGHSLREGWRAQWLATVGLAPLTLVLFGQLSVVGLLANLVAVPLVTFVVTPLALAGVLVPPLWRWADLVLVPLLAWLDTLAAWPGAVWAAPAAPVWAQALALLAGLLWILPWPRVVRLLAVFWVLPLCFPAVNAPKEGEFELLALDVGQGSAVLVRTAHHVLLHDTGPRHAAGSDAGRRIVLPELQALGVRRVDTLVLSHRDQDHVGGAASVLAGLPVSQMLVSLEPGHALRQAGPAVQDCQAGQSWQWDGVRFDVLHPQHPVPAGRGPWGAPALKPNAHSCVLRVQDAQGRSALLTGDIEAAQEAELVARHGASLRSTVLVVPHHGSRTSSSPAFLAAVAPRTAVIQVAYRSHFGHPHPTVLQRYHQRGIDVVRADHCGAWRWRADAADCTREVRQHHWRSNFDLPSSGAGSDVARVGFAGERE